MRYIQGKIEYFDVKSRTNLLDPRTKISNDDKIIPHRNNGFENERSWSKDLKWSDLRTTQDCL